MRVRRRVASPRYSASRLFMGRLLTFRQLQTQKGWPHSRQWTSKLAKQGKIPAPRKRPGGSINVWDESIWDSFQDSFVSSLPQPAQVALTTTLIEALSTTSIDGVVNAVERLRAILDHEGAAASDVVVSLKPSLPAPTQVPSEAATTTTVSDSS